MTTNEDNPAMSTNVHDPLCPRPLCDYGEPDGQCYGYEDCTHDCQCALIAKVRAYEQDRAEQVIKKHCGHTKYEGCQPCWHDLMARDLYEEA